MREIKFRVWNKKDKQMYEVSSIDFYFEFINWKPNKDGSETRTFMEWEDCELIEYTGLKDKNGKEIYEGDIVRVNSGIAKILWQFTGAFGFVLKYIEDELNTIMIAEDCYEVIGNIYENPELLQ